MRALARAWRLAVAATGFALFGLGCLALTLLALPALRLLPGSARARELRVRRLIGGSMRGLVRLLQAIGALSFEVEGAGRLGRPGQLILANHPTLFDAVLLLGLAPASTCIVKEALWHNPFVRWPVAAAGYVSNRSADRMIEQAADALRAGQSVIIFPEGTRTAPGQPMRLQRGAAAIAVRAAAVVTPVYIRCNPSTLTKGQPWYRFPERCVNFSLQAGADIDPEPFRRGAPAPIAARELNERLLEAFSALGRCE
ncbi:MAG: lysophospholipid acyltransferase family protein [Steroidobacteraceae bacterium]